MISRHTVATTAAGGEGDCACSRGDGVARDHSDLHGAGRVFGKTRRGTEEGFGSDYRSARTRRDRREGSDAAGCGFAGRICEGPRNHALERAGERSHGCGDGTAPETGEDFGI